MYSAKGIAGQQPILQPHKTLYLGLSRQIGSLIMSYHRNDTPQITGDHPCHTNRHTKPHGLSVDTGPCGLTSTWRWMGCEMDRPAKLETRLNRRLHKLQAKMCKNQAHSWKHGVLSLLSRSERDRRSQVVLSVVLSGTLMIVISQVGNSGAGIADTRD